MHAHTCAHACSTHAHAHHPCQIRLACALQFVTVSFPPPPCPSGAVPGVPGRGPRTCLPPTTQPASPRSEQPPCAPTPQSLPSPAPSRRRAESPHRKTVVLASALAWPDPSPQCPRDCGVLGAAEGVGTLVPVTSRQAPGRTAPAVQLTDCPSVGGPFASPPETGRAGEPQLNRGAASQPCRPVFPPRRLPLRCSATKVPTFKKQ